MYKIPPGSFAKVVSFVICSGKEHLKRFNESIIAKGGEGVMLREPGSLYKQGRSTSLRKYKPLFDADVKVIKNASPYGFQCENVDGKTVFVSLPNELQNEAKSIEAGSVITVKHAGLNPQKMMMYPQFYRQRTDVNWQDVLNKKL